MRSHISSARRRTAALIAALLTSALVLSGCSIYDVPLPGGVDTGKNPMKITLMFRDVLDLVPQSTVKVDDVTVGKVKSIKLKGYVAEVTVEIPKKVDLPDNTTAQIRQTSLLGEKFVALDRPENPSSGRLSNNDVIGLDRTGRNPEVEEVLGALALLLNGGGVGQLKTIVSELNNAFTGREDDVRSVLTQIRTFMGQLDDNKDSIVQALENTNRLALQIRKQDGTIKSALDNIPDALRSVNRQRADLVKLLKALTRLSGVGVQVIKASKASTINSLRELAPVLEGFAKAGENFPKSFQVFLTYPFVDAAVGRDPQVARNLHMGDYTNLSINLDLDVADLPKLPTGPVGDACKQARDAVIQGIQDSQLPQSAKDTLIATAEQAPCNALGDPTTYLSNAIKNLCKTVAIPGVCETPGGPITLPPLPTITLGALPGLNNGLPALPGLPRAQLGQGYQVPTPLDPFHLAARGLDPGIGTILLQGVAEVR
jgi:phospholipid/cholesterol/gamma-HCH transport system substrate-binding protein